MTYLTQGDDFDGILGPPPSTQQRSNFGFAQYSLSQFVDVDDDEEVDFDNMRTTETKIKEEEIEAEDNDSVEQDVLIEEPKTTVQLEESTTIATTENENTNIVATEEPAETVPPAENEHVASQELFTDSQEFYEDEILHDDEQIIEEVVTDGEQLEAKQEQLEAAVDDEPMMEQQPEINPEATVEDTVVEQSENNVVEDTTVNVEQNIVAEDTIIPEQAGNFDAESQNSMEIPIIPEDEIYCDFPVDSQNQDFFDEPVTIEPTSPVPTEQPNPSTTSPEKVQLVEKVEKVEAPVSTQASPFKKSLPKEDIEVVAKPSPSKRYQPPLDVEQAGKYFNLSTLQRGIAYKDEGRVFNMDDECLCDADNTQLMRVTSKCWGTRLDAYDTEVLVQIDSKNNIKVTRARCNCPMTTDCKHCVASIMIWLECRRENKPIPRTESLAARLRDTTSDMLKMKEEMDAMHKEHETLKMQVATLTEMFNKQRDVKMKEPAPVVKQPENSVLGKRKDREEKDDTADSDIEYNDASQEDEPPKKVKKTVHFEEMPSTLLYSPYDSQSQSSQQQFLDY